jgi:hypothetical protein
MSLVRWLAVIVGLLLLGGLVPQSRASEWRNAPEDKALPHPVLVRWSCGLALSAPYVTTACGTTVCEYRVICSDLSGKQSALQGKAYCPLRGRRCAPYKACELPDYETSSEIAADFERQCTNVRKS